MKAKFLDAILVMVLLVTVVSGFAHTWEQTSTYRFYQAVSLSADGRIVCAVDSGGYQISTNSGKTWSTLALTHSIGGVGPNGAAISADGTKIHAVALANSSWLSTNQGLTWKQTGFPAAAAFQIACSADGTKVIAAWNGPIYFSTNSGDNCYTSSVPSATWVSLASAADGRRMVAAAYSGDIYFSTNYGALWTPAGFSPQGWRSACVSGDGKWIGAISTNNTYISSNAGIDWITNNMSGYSIACSANGSTWIIAGAQLYTSTDGGVNWLTNLPSVSPFRGVISADGCEMACVEFNGVWMGRATPTPQLNIQPQDSDVVLSWLVPSTNFVLQQNADLGTTNWVAVSNNPALNFTNLQQAVTVPTITNAMFFRLMAQ